MTWSRVASAAVLVLVVCVLAACSRPSQAEESAACAKAQEALESVRRNIGGWCGTPDMEANAQIVALGAAVVPCLRGALADRDYEVALAAAFALRDLRETKVLSAWCAEHPGHPNAGVCSFRAPSPRSSTSRP